VEAAELAEMEKLPIFFWAEWETYNYYGFSKKTFDFSFFSFLFFLFLFPFPHNSLQDQTPIMPRSNPSQDEEEENHIYCATRKSLE